jgi:putative mRNA 3-end processing factor
MEAQPTPSGTIPGIVEWDGGIRLSGTSLWLDARRPVPLSFLSSALAFHRHQRIIASAQTLEILGARLGSSEVLPSPFRRPFSVGELVLELLPAGQVPGSALLLVRKGELTVLYCGGVRLGRSLVAEPCQVPRADVLVLDCPYDEPPYDFPTQKRAVEDLTSWIRGVIAQGETPLLLAGELGMAQEVCQLLSAEGLPTRVHRHIAAVNRRVRTAGIPLARVPALRDPASAGEVVVAPLRASGSTLLRRLVPRARVALVSGRAAAPGAAEHAGAETGFAWSCNADGKDLRQVVRDSGARHVYLGARHSGRFEAGLKRLGLGVTRLAESEEGSQLDLFDGGRTE